MAEDTTMQTSRDPSEIKDRLQELIDNSAALKALSDEARKTRVDLMLGAKPETMLQFIQVFEQEQADLQKIDEEFAPQEAEIAKLLDEAKDLEKEAEREIRKAEEEEERGTEVAQAEDLLKKLDDIQDDQK